MDREQPPRLTRSRPLTYPLGRRAHRDGCRARGLVGVGDVLERVVAGDRQRTRTALIERDVGVGDAAASEGLGRSRSEADRAGAGDSQPSACCGKRVT